MRPHAVADAILRHALSLPGAHEDHPWGEVVAKAKGKVFVFFGRRAEPVLRFSVKLPVSGERWLDQEFAEPTAYGMGPHGWVTFTFDSGNVLSERELLPLVEESYRAVAAKTLVKELDARQSGAAARPESATKRTKKSAGRKTSKKTPPRGRRRKPAQ